MNIFTITEVLAFAPDTTEWMAMPAVLLAIVGIALTVYRLNFKNK